MTSTSRREIADIDMVRSMLEDEYDILEELGRGGMAVVYRALERELDREVAIKVLPFSMGFDGGFVERFQREARTAARLEHPHIIPVYRVGRTGQVSYFVMKFVRGQALSDLLRKHGMIPAAQLRRILMETASALGYAAGRGVVHRDIKPDNIMLEEDGRCVIADFGIARSASDSKLTSTGMSVGTPRYMSPEQARAKDIDGRSDIYSLGIVGYECLVGMTPFDGDDALAILMDHINAPLPHPVLGSAEDRALFEVIERMLAKQPSDRFQTAGDLIAALHATRVDSSTSRSGTVASFSVAPGPSYDIPVPPLVVPAKAGIHSPLTPTRPGPAVPGEPWRSRGAIATALQGARAIVALHGPEARHAMMRARRYIVNRNRTFWVTSAAASIACIVLYYGLHFATKHQSRCPQPVAAAVSPAPDVAATPQTPARTLSLLVDAIGTRGGGSELDVYYDVCGLERGTSYTTRVTVVKNESGLKRIFGRSVDPIIVSYDETAAGPATRRHRTLDVSGMPAGAYTLGVKVTNKEGQVREKNIEFQVLEH
ncbi:MAG: serine/threonine-protein kinase [Gemmatimonadaceae bacterium]